MSEAFYKDENALAGDAAEVPRTMAEVSQIWKEYAATCLTPEEKVLAARFDAARTRFVQEGITPALSAMRAADASRLKALVEGPLRQLAIPVRSSVRELVALQLTIGKAEYAD